MFKDDWNHSMVMFGKWIISQKNHKNSKYNRRPNLYSIVVHPEKEFVPFLKSSIIWKLWLFSLVNLKMENRATTNERTWNGDFFRLIFNIYCIMIELTNELPNGWPPAPIATCWWLGSMQIGIQMGCWKKKKLQEET